MSSRVASATPLDIDTSCLASGVVFGDRRRVGQVVRNLLDNATHHASTKIRVESLLAAGQVVLSIGDDGPGIPPADRERIFDRFVRLDKARSRQSGGTGLGLSVVRSIVDAHHGTIIVDRDHDLGGASITVMLPVGLAGQGSSVAAT